MTGVSLCYSTVAQLLMAGSDPLLIGSLLLGGHDLKEVNDAFYGEAQSRALIDKHPLLKDRLLKEGEHKIAPPRVCVRLNALAEPWFHAVLDELMAFRRYEINLYLSTEVIAHQLTSSLALSSPSEASEEPDVQYFSARPSYKEALLQHTSLYPNQSSDDQKDEVSSTGADPLSNKSVVVNFVPATPEHDVVVQCKFSQRLEDFTKVRLFEKVCQNTTCFSKKSATTDVDLPLSRRTRLVHVSPQVLELLSGQFLSHFHDFVYAQYLVLDCGLKWSYVYKVFMDIALEHGELTTDGCLTAEAFRAFHLRIMHDTQKMSGGHYRI